MTQDALHELNTLVGDGNVEIDAAEVQCYSNDLFFWSDAKCACAVVAPPTSEAIAALIGWARAHDYKLFTRGGGMSCSAGYVPNSDRSVVVDMRQLNQIRRVDLTNGFVEVECGATWESLFAELERHGVTTVFEAPVSGNVSTVGGALSQGVTGTMEGVLGLEVVTGQGEVLRTGSGARNDCTNPFFRQFGPDLTGLFCGDAGALGIKTAATLALQPTPGAQAHASFAFESFSDLVKAAGNCGSTHQLSRCIGLDPKKSENAPKVGFKKSIESVMAILGNTPRGRLAEAIRIARSGRNFMEGVTWSLHLSAAGVNADVAEARLAEARRLCLRKGREIANLLPLALASQPFSVRGFLGPDAQRWVPVNAVFACSQAEGATKVLEAFFEARRSQMNRFAIWESFLVRGHAHQVVIEPSLYWPDEVSALQLRHLDSATAKRLAERPPNLEARACVMELHSQMVECLDQAGAAHIQLGRCHSYLSRVSRTTADFVQAIKSLTDPRCQLNPGSLGLNPGQSRR